MYQSATDAYLRTFEQAEATNKLLLLLYYFVSQNFFRFAGWETIVFTERWIE